MIVPDANVLVYAYDRTSDLHRVARRWWESVLSGSEPIGIPWVVILAFVRLHPEHIATLMTNDFAPFGRIAMEGSRLRLPEASQTPPGAASSAPPGF